jgi:hypothetical protein
MTKKHRFIQRAERFPLQRPIYYRRDDSSDWLKGKTENISRTGILFHAKEAFKPDLELDIRVAFPLKMTLSCQGTIVRIDRSGGRKAAAVQIHNYNLLSSDKSSF